jgi:membrane associated rhomboid family serine protease
MVFPISDDDSDRRSVPLINYALIAANVFVFVVFQGLGENEKFTMAFATVPQEILTGKDVETPDRHVRDPATGRTVTVPGLQPTPIPVYLTLLTSMFMHGGLAHLLGNMLFLWIFGDNVEDVLGHVRYLVFYLVCGVLASLTHVFVTQALGGDLKVPSLGASGAISGVLAGYILLFPYKRVTVILFRVLTQVPAYVAIGIWFAFQIIESIGALGGTRGGVAYGAHIGGFIFGAALIKVFMLGRDSGGEPPPAGRWVQR